MFGYAVIICPGFDVSRALRLFEAFLVLTLKKLITSSTNSLQSSHSMADDDLMLMRVSSLFSSPESSVVLISDVRDRPTRRGAPTDPHSHAHPEAPMVCAPG